MGLSRDNSTGFLIQWTGKYGISLSDSYWLPFPITFGNIYGIFLGYTRTGQRLPVITEKYNTGVAVGFEVLGSASMTGDLMVIAIGFS